VLDAPLSAEMQNSIKQDLKQSLEDFNLAHTTFEFEQSAEFCRDGHIPR